MTNSLTFKTVFDAMASTLMRFGSAVERLLVIALVVVWGLIAGISTGWADASTIVVNKKVCDATLLPVNIATDPLAASLLEGCENLLSTPASTLTYYVIKVEDLIGQTVSVTDNLPAGFTPTSAPFCVGTGCPTTLGSGPTYAGFNLGPAGAPAYLVIPGYFNALGPVENQAVVTTAGGDVKPSIAHQVYVGTPTPPPGNLKVEKTANITSGSMQGGAGSVTVSYSITVTNTGTNSLNLGGIFELIDNVKALQGSSLGFDYVAQNFQYIGCSPWPTTGISCPELQPGSNTSGMTTNSTTGSVLGIWKYAAGDPGTLPAGGSYTITFDVEYTLNNTVVCTWPGTIDGVRNTAYIRFANGQNSFSDTIAADNTSFVELEVDDHGVTDICEPQPPTGIQIKKRQVSPLGLIPWGTPVTYEIDVTNISGGLIPSVTVSDSVTMLPGMPLVDVTALSMTCPSCINNLPNTGVTQSLSTYNVPAQVGSATIQNLGAGQTETITVTIVYKPRSCVSYQSDNRQTEDIASYEYKINGKHGMVWTYNGSVGGVITDHDKVPACTLKTGKTGPKDVTYGSNIEYQVTYENYGDDPISVGTLMDSISLSSPVYASPNVSGSYKYGCSYYINGVAQAWGPGNLVQYMSGVPIAVGYNVFPGQGTRLLHNLNPAAPIVLPAHSKIICDFSIFLTKPTSANPYCQGAGTPKLVNSSLMDVTSFFNTNFDPSTTPTPYTVQPPQAYASTEAGLPLCHRFATGKTMSQSVMGVGDIITVTLTLKNLGDDPITGATLTDAVPAGLTPLVNTMQCPLCAPPVVNGTPTQNVSVVFGQLNGGQTGTVTFQAQANAPAPQAYLNIDEGSFTPPPGNWYDQESIPKGYFNFGVFEMRKVSITKQVVSTVGQTFPAGPFLINVNCTLPAYQSIGWSYGTTVSATAGGSFTLPQLIPVGAVCTFTETTLPNSPAPFGFSAVGYEPAASSGLSGVINVTATGNNTGVVENCYGKPGHTPALQTPHVVGKDCPPAPDEFSVRKVCDPAVLAADGTSFIANCRITVGTSGQFPAGYSVQELLSGSNGEINFVGSTPANLTWQCDPSPTTAPGPLNCAFAGGVQANPGPNSSTLFYSVTFKDKDEVYNTKNCAITKIREETLGEDCVGFDVGDPPKVDITKVCEPAVRRKHAFGPAIDGLAYFSDCTITVNASGPVYGTLTVSDAFTSVPGGSAVVTALTAAGWTCSPTPLPFTPVTGGFTCTMPGAMFPASGTSTITATVMLPIGENSAQNCATVLIDDEKQNQSCDDIVVVSPPRVTKVCEQPYLPVGSTQWQVRCEIVVTPQGAMSGTITLDDVMSMIGGSASITSYNAPVPWTCAPTAPVTAPAPLSCSADAGQITAPSTISLTMSVAPGTRGLKNCAVAAINGEPLDQSCVDIDIPPPPVVDIDKQCKPAVWDAATQRFKANCVITVSTTPSYPNGYLTFTERMTASGAAATLASLTQSGWTCTPPAVPPALNTPVLVACSRPAAGFTSSTIGLVVTFPNATTGIKNCANLYWSAQPLTPGQTLQQQPVDKSCTKIVKDFGKADIEKKCTEATLLPAPNPTGRYGSACTITVTTSGPVQTPLSFTENLTGNGVTTFTSSSPAGWACVPSPVINGTTMNCSIGNSLVSPVSNSWTIGFDVSFANASHADAARNCVKLRAGQVVKDESCHDFVAVTPTPFTLNATKSCVLLQQLGDQVSVLDCTITVTASGSPFPPTITLTENLQSTSTNGGTSLGLYGVYSTDPWVCPPNQGLVSPNTPVNCTIPGSSFPVSGTSTLHAYVYYGSGTVPGTTQNCVSASSNGNPPASSGPNCVPLGPPAPVAGQLAILKIATLNGRNIPQQTFPFEVNCGGTITNLDVQNSAGVGLVTAIPFGTSCTVEEGQQPTTGVCPPGQVASWNTTYSPATPITITQQNPEPTVTVTNLLTCTAAATIVVPPKCDTSTAKLVKGACACTVPGMRLVSKTDCACVKGEVLKNGRCVLPPPPPPPAPKCDKDTARLQNGKCVCTIRGMVPVSKLACACIKGQELRNGRCRDVAPPPPPPPKCDRDTAVAKAGKCVCRFRNMQPVSRSACECRRGFDFDPRRGCVRAVLDCPEGTTQVGPLCVRIKRDEPKEDECPRGTRKRGRFCVPVLRDPPKDIDAPRGGEQCLDRNGKEVPC